MSGPMNKNLPVPIRVLFVLIVVLESIIPVTVMCVLAPITGFGLVAEAIRNFRAFVCS